MHEGRDIQIEENTTWKEWTQLIDATLVNRALATGERLGAEYVEIRSEKVDHWFLECYDSEITTSTIRRDTGVCARVLYRKTWGFSCSYDFEKVEEVVVNACKSAKASSALSLSPVALAAVVPVSNRVPLQVRRPPSQVDVEEKCDLLILEHKLLTEYPHTRHVLITYEDGERSTCVFTNQGTAVETTMQYLWQYLSVTGKKDVTATAGEEIGSADQGWEFFDHQTLEDAVSRILRKLECNLSGKPVKEGTYAVLLGPQTTGLLVHESIGHMLESDNFQSTGLQESMNQQIMAELVTVTDYASMRGGFGNTPVDDEGVIARDVCLIEKGILRAILVDRAHASLYGIAPAGNSRAEDFRAPPQVRMRNTVVEPGDWTQAELTEMISDGYYCAGARKGSLGLDSSFHISVDECYRVENGELSHPVRNATMRGDALTLMQNVQAVGKDLAVFPKKCKKRQTVTVGCGGPHILVKGGIWLG